MPGFLRPLRVFPWVNRSNTCHGLCGGMCFAALDWMQTAAAVPPHSTPPPSNTQFYQYLYQRQFDTYGTFWQVTGKFLKWTALPDDSVSALTLRELHSITCSLKQNKPVVLGLVFTRLSETIAIWKNHQVLAYRYSESDTQKLHVYDPNYPGNDNIWIEITHKENNYSFKLRSVDGKKGLAIRGFFVIPYTPKPLPPSIHSS